jgi:spore maturation protein CgeB
MSYRFILNPFGILRGLNTRAYETLYSGRVLLQHTVGEYSRHEKMLKDNPGVIFFRDFEDLKRKTTRLREIETDCTLSFEEGSLHSRMKKIGAW